MRMAYFWRKRTLFSLARAKECLAFDLYSLLKVADAQTSSGTSRIVLAPSAKHARTRILSAMAQRYKTIVASCLQFMWEFYPRYILDPSRMQREIYNCRQDVSLNMINVTELSRMCEN